MRPPASLIRRRLASAGAGLTLLVAGCTDAGSDAEQGLGGQGTSGSSGSAPIAGAGVVAGSSASAGGSAGSGTGGMTSGGSAGSPASGGTGGSTGGSGGSGDAGVSGAMSSGGGSGTGASGGASAGAGGSDAGGAGAGSGGKGGSGASGGGGSGGGLVGADPSAGCMMAPPASARYTIDVMGTEREYILKVPDGYDPEAPHRLVFTFHGRMYSAQTVADGGPPGSGPYYGIESEAGGSTVFVAPQALSSSWTNEGGRDVDYVVAMVDRIESELCIDRTRVFAVGFSFGAIMTIAVGCERSDLFRAIAPMSGSLMNGCAGDEPLAYWGSHGSADNTITLASGQAVRDEFVARNGCDAQSMPSQPDGCESYPGCADGAPVSFCVFDGEHEPPPYAGSAIWNFFAQF